MGKLQILQMLLWVLEGIIVGFGAIMPGISGGTLCVAFGMYKPLISVISSPRKTLRQYGKMLLFFVIGCAVGFIGLSGLASWLMQANSQAVTCAFIGLILGTVPELWTEAREKGRTPGTMVSLGLGFAVMLGILLLLRAGNLITMQPGILSFGFCGLMWGISFVVPGLSSSTLLLFFGLYQPMLDGIARLSPAVILPLAIGMVVVLLTLPKGVNALFARHDAICSHVILGVMLATLVMIFPPFPAQLGQQAAYVAYIAAGAVASYFLSKLCARVAARQQET